MDVPPGDPIDVAFFTTDPESYRMAEPFLPVAIDEDGEVLPPPKKQSEPRRWDENKWNQTKRRRKAAAASRRKNR